MDSANFSVLTHYLNKYWQGLVLMQTIEFWVEISFRENDWL